MKKKNRRPLPSMSDMQYRVTDDNVLDNEILEHYPIMLHVRNK